MTDDCTCWPHPDIPETYRPYGWWIGDDNCPEHSGDDSDQP